MAWFRSIEKLPSDGRCTWVHPACGVRCVTTGGRNCRDHRHPTGECSFYGRRDAGQKTEPTK